MRQFLNDKRKESRPDDSWQEVWSWAVFIIEKECNQYIGWDYPLMKFFSQIRNLEKLKREEKKQMERAKKQ